MFEGEYRNVSDSDFQRNRERQSIAWKTLMNACKLNSIDPVTFANIIGTSHGEALKFFKQGYIELKLNDEQYARLGRATNHTANYWKSLFEMKSCY